MCACFQGVGQGDRDAGNTALIRTSSCGFCFYFCGLLQGIDVLEAALRASPATIVTAEPFLFNLCECAISVCTVFFLISGCLRCSHAVRAPFDGRC